MINDSLSVFVRLLESATLLAMASDLLLLIRFLQCFYGEDIFGKAGDGGSGVSSLHEDPLLPFSISRVLRSV